MTKRPAGRLGSDWQWIVALVIFVCGAFGGFALTALPKLSLQDWGCWVGGRIVWQLGGAIWCGATIAAALGAPELRWKGALLVGLLGLVLCFNPVLDVIAGPQLWEGQVTQAEIWQQRLYRAGGGSTLTIHAQINIETREKEHQLKLSGRQVNLWGDVFAQCYQSGDIIRAVILPNLKIVLDAECAATNSDVSRPTQHKP